VCRCVYYYSRPHVWDGCFVLRLCVLYFLNSLFILFCQPNLSRPWTDLAEICTLTGSWCDLWTRNAGLKWGLTPPKNFLGLKSDKFRTVPTVRSLTLERKRISACLKRLCNRKEKAYEMYVRPWPLTSGCKHCERLYMYKCEKFTFFTILSKFSAVTPVKLSL